MQTIYNVYHYRGKLVFASTEKQDAIDYIAKQKIPTEYYWERDSI